MMVKKLTQMKSGKTINVGVSVKIRNNIMFVKKTIDNSLITCNEIIKLTKNTSAKIIPTKSTSTKTLTTKNTNKFLYFAHLFINYHSIINGC